MITIAVIGSGSIGPDLAYGFASALSNSPFRLWLHDVSDAQLQAGISRIRGYVEKAVSRGKLNPKRAQAALEGIVATTDIKSLSECRYVLEAASENLDVKRKILADLEQQVDGECLIGFATSGLCRSWIVEQAKRPERCFVNHPFYPAWRSLPMEVVPSEDAIATQQMLKLLIQLGKIPILTKDTPCFAADDVFCNLECEAFRILEDGLASPAQIDSLVDRLLGGGGPFRVADMTQGNLLIAHCQELLATHYANSWFNAPDILIGQGKTPWYEAPHQDRQLTPSICTTIEERILAVYLARAFHLVEQGICEPGDLDWLLRNSLGFKKGPLQWAQELGMDEVKRITLAYANHNPKFPISQSIMDLKLPVFLENLQVSEPDEDGVVRVMVRRPEVLNALNAKTIAELDRVFTDLEARSDARAIVFGGVGGALAGADIGELAALTSPSDGVALAARGQQLTLKMARMSLPIVAVCDGPVLGGGAELAMACWARVVGPKTVIGQPEVNLGIIPGFGGTQRLPRIVGVQTAYRWMATGMSLGARDAVESGWAYGAVETNPSTAAQQLLVDHLCGRVELKPVSESALAESRLHYEDIGHHSLAIDRILRRVIESGTCRSLPDGLAIEAEGFGACFETKDMSLGLASFLANGARVPAVFLHY